MSKDIKTIGQRIRECRKEMGYSQETLAAMLYIKKNTICRYEKDEHDIPSSMLIKLANVLHTTPNYLLLGDSSEDEWIEDMINILKRIRTEEHRTLVRKQVELVAELLEN